MFVRSRLARAHSKALRVYPALPHDHKVLECVCASAALGLPQAWLPN
jgi:hypothetical protein